VREAGFLLQVSEMKVRRLGDCGVLTLVGAERDGDAQRRIRIDPESVQRALPQDGTSALRLLFLQAILDRRFTVPPPPSRWGLPVGLDAAAARMGVNGHSSGLSVATNETTEAAQTLNSTAELQTSRPHSLQRTTEMTVFGNTMQHRQSTELRVG